MNAEGGGQLGQDVAEGPCLAAGVVGGGARVAVHGVALPDGAVAAGFHGADVPREDRGDARGAVTGDECNFSGGAGGVNSMEESDKIAGGESGADFDADRVLDAANIFDMGACELASAVTDPEEVRRCVIVASVRGRGID